MTSGLPVARVGPGLVEGPVHPCPAKVEVDLVHLAGVHVRVAGEGDAVVPGHGDDDPPCGELQRRNLGESLGHERRDERVKGYPGYIRLVPNVLVGTEHHLRRISYKLCHSTVGLTM